MSEQNKQGELKKVLGFWDCMGIGIGQIIGSGLDLETISRLGNGVALIYVMFPIATGYIIHKKNPAAMANSTFKVSQKPLIILTTVALIGYAMAAVLNFGDIQSAWQLMLVYSLVIIAYAFWREKKVVSLTSAGK